MKQVFRIGIYILALVLISSCGGSDNGGGGDETPNAPSNVQAILLDGNIRVSWEHDGKNLTGFSIYRNEGMPIGENAENAQKIGDTAADVKVYVDEDSLDPSKQYSYSVAAKGGSTESARVATEEPIQAAPKTGDLRVRALFGGEGGGGVIKSSDNAINCTEPGGAKCSSDFQTGSTVTLEATPNTGSEFVGWEGAECTGTGPCNVSVSSANDPDNDSIIEVTALFNQTGYLLSVDKRGTGTGTVVSTPSGINCGDDCEEAYLIPAQGSAAIKVGFSSVTVADGSLFNGWGGACPTATATSSCVVTMDDDKTVEAFFSKPTADSYSVGEGETLEQAAPGVLVNDVALAGGVDLDTEPVEGPENGTLTLKADGSFTYEHDDSNTTSDSFVYRVSDERGNDAEITVSLSITAGDDPPVAEDDVYAVAEDVTLNVSVANGVLKNDTDDEGDQLSAERKTDVENGLLTFNTNGSFIYTPDTNFSGTDSFTYVAKAGGQESAPATVTITVSDTNDPPVAEDGTATVLEDTSVEIELEASDDGDALTYAIVEQPENGTISGGTTNTRTYTPAPNSNGTDSFTFKANDGATDSNTSTVTITVTPVNDAPSFTLSQTAVDASAGPIANFATNISKGAANEAAQTLTFTVSRTDDGDLEFDTDPTISSTGVLNYAVEDGSDGTATFRVVLKDSGGTANDGDDTSSARTFSITAEPEEEVISVTVTPASATVLEGGTRQLNVQVVTEGGAASTVTWTSSDEDIATVSATGLVTAVAASATPVIITATSTEDSTKSDTASITVTAPNQAPTADAGPNQTNAVIGTIVNLDGSGSSDDGPISYSWALTTKPDGSAATLTNPNTAAPSFTPDVAGNYVATLTVTDDDDATDTDTVTIAVGTANQPPTAVGGTATVLEDESVQIALEANDDDGDTLTYTIVSPPTNGTLSGTGQTRTYTPDEDFNGDDSFTFRVRDGSVNSNTATVAITVTRVNDAPSFTLSQTTVNGPSGNVPGFATGISEGAANEAPQTVNFIVTRTDTDGGLVFATAPAIVPTGVLSYEVEANSVGTASFRVVLRDSGGTANGGENTSSARTFTITVEPEEEVTSLTVTPPAATLEPGNVQRLAVTVVVRGGADNSVTWTSSNPQVATVSATGLVRARNTDAAPAVITATSVADPTMSDSASITVASTNQPPVATGGAAPPVLEDESVDITLNATDSDDDALSYSIVTPPQNGTLSGGTTSTRTYKPNENFNGADSFTFKANDGSANSNIATITINVATVNDVPTSSGIQDVELDDDDQVFSINLYNVFDDVEDDDEDLEFAGEVSNENIFTRGFINNGRLVLILNGEEGSSNVTVRARDTEDAFVDTSFTLTVEN